MKRRRTEAEAAEILAVSIDTLRRIRQAGRIAYQQQTPRGRVYYRDEDLEDYQRSIEHRPVRVMTPRRARDGGK